MKTYRITIEKQADAPYTWEDVTEATFAVPDGVSDDAIASIAATTIGVLAVGFSEAAATAAKETAVERIASGVMSRFAGRLEASRSAASQLEVEHHDALAATLAAAPVVEPDDGLDQEAEEATTEVASRD